MDNDTSTVHGLVQRAQAVAQELDLARRELAGLELTGSAGGGLVTVTVRGDGEVTRVVIGQAAVDQGDAVALSALTLSALRNATDAIRATAAERTSAITGTLPAALAAHRRPIDRR